MSINISVPLDIILNCILVNEDVRPAMLVQPVNYKEETHNDIKTKFILEEIKKYFPKLLLTTDYDLYQGVIVSKSNYNGKRDISLKEMGKILGYPCYKYFDTDDTDEDNDDDDDKTQYVISVCVKYNDNKIIELFANKCKDEKNLKEFNILAHKAKIAFSKKDYNKILNEIEIKEVFVESLPIISTKTIINKLLKNEKLKQEEIEEIDNILYNLGFSMNLKNYFLDKFQYNNPIHKGILLELLLNYEHDTLTPFFPLQQYHKQAEEVNKIIKNWENDLLKILEKTEINYFKYFGLFKNGGRKQTTHRKKHSSNKKTRSTRKINNISFKSSKM